MAIDTETGKEAPAELSTQRVQSIFSSIAPRYERFNAWSSLGTYRHWRQALVEAAPVDGQSVVLDVAGGTGDVSFALARAKHPAHIVCTDLVPEMLRVAENHYQNGAADGVTIGFSVADAQALPFSDGSFDVVTIAYGIRNIPDRKRALTEMHRVLKPGGSLLCLEFSTPSNPLWRALYGFYRDHIIPLWGRLIAGESESFTYLAHSIKAFPTQADYAALLESVGFSEVSWQNLTGGIAALHIASKPSNH